MLVQHHACRREVRSAARHLRTARESRPEAAVGHLWNNLTGEVGKTVPCEVVVITDDNSIEPIVKVTKVEGTTVSYEMTLR